jgi:hypothetical protein
MRIVGLHKLPFDASKFEQDIESCVGSDDEEDARQQCQENWDNAYLVVIETKLSSDDLDFGAFGHPSETGQPPNDMQAVWSEEILDNEPGRTRAAFYLHYVNQGLPLYYGAEELLFPEQSTADPAIWEQIPYSSPS